MTEESLDSIMIATGTDKATKHPVKGHGYSNVYDEAFAEFRYEKIRLLETGVGGGESVRAWLKYFPYAHIFGVDKVHDTNPYNTPKGKIDGYTFNTGDMSDPTFWKCLNADWPGGFDIVIDDSGHFNDEMIKCFECLWPLVNTGGLYCIEDLGVGHDSTSVFVKPSYPRHMDWIKQLMDKMNSGTSDIQSVHFTKELAILKKS